jgi:hypothetical protein
MSKTLAELRQSSRVGLPKRTYSLCLAPALVDEVRQLVGRLSEAEVAAAAQADGDGDKARPRRAAEESPVQAVRDRLRALRDEMAEHTGELTLQGLTEGQWRAWVDDHPPREDNDRDRRVAFGYCNADDLLDDLGTYAHTWNGEKLTPGDWDFVKSNAAPGDLKELVQAVVSMHEMAVDAPKLLSDLLGIVDAESG